MNPEHFSIPTLQYSNFQYIGECNCGMQFRDWNRDRLSEQFRDHFADMEKNNRIRLIDEVIDASLGY